MFNARITITKRRVFHESFPLKRHYVDKPLIHNLRGETVMTLSVLGDKDPSEGGGVIPRSRRKSE